jgi:hypothetical protein
MSIHTLYLVSDLEGRDNSDPLYGIISNNLLLLVVIHGVVCSNSAGTPGRTELFQV